jgi:hypothetical protein
MDYALLSGEPKEKETPLIPKEDEAQRKETTLLSTLQTWFEYLFNVIVKPPSIQVTGAQSPGV